MRLLQHNISIILIAGILFFTSSFIFIPLAHADTANTTFVFSGTAESWTYTDDNANCSGAYTGSTGNPSGSLQTTGSKSGGGTTCNAYWEWTGTWESLGVPSGNQVTGITGSYEYAVSDDSSNGTWDTGAFELRNSGGTLRETMVTALTGQIGTAGFTSRSGSEQAFTAEASSTSIRLRISTVIAFGGGTRTWAGQLDNIAVTVTHQTAGALSVDIVDSGGTSVSSPSVTFPSQDFSFDLITSSATLGTSSQRIRVDNGTATASWSLTIGATSGSTALWSSGSADYDYNDPTASGGDGADGDSVGGQLTINPSVGTISPQSGCSTTGVSLGSSSAFSEGVTDSITLASASGSAETGCYWDITGVTVSQEIPASQDIGTYTLDVTLTVS